jgi:hypothetical protein
MIIRIWHITRRRRTTRENIEEMVKEPHELLLNICTLVERCPN